MKNKYFRQLKKFKPREIQSTIMIAFSVVSISIMLILGIVLYLRFSNSAREETIESTQKLMEQTGENLEDYLVSMRQISDAVYYNVIKENDFDRNRQDIQRGMNLLYEANKDNLRSIAIYNNYGSLIAAEPVAAQKEDPDVTSQNWYQQAVEEMENMHFSTPHIQNLFNDTTYRYYWVISLSRAVELTNQGGAQTGVLLVDMDFSSISRMMNQINDINNGQYYYLCDSEGEIIYHPRQIQISDGIYEENSRAAASYKDGVYEDAFKGENRKLVVNTISYTGWKLIGVIPYSTFNRGMVNIRYFIAMLMLLMAMMLVVINRVVSLRISSPILKLNHSVREYEAGKKPEIYIGGSQEIRHLGYSIQKSYEQIDKLMKEIVLEQNERRKSERDALQSQIHPHFLYNTLDTINWMLLEKKEYEISGIVVSLGEMMKYAISRSSRTVALREEIRHVSNYLLIQKERMEDKLEYEIDIPHQYESVQVPRLILQPLVENAIIHGIETGGKVSIRVYEREEDGGCWLEVSDNGAGMDEEQLKRLRDGTTEMRMDHRSIGVENVNKRIRLYYGEEFGLMIESRLGEGTVIRFCIPGNS